MGKAMEKILKGSQISSYFWSRILRKFDANFGSLIDKFQVISVTNLLFWYRQHRIAELTQTV